MATGRIRSRKNSTDPPRDRHLKNAQTMNHTLLACSRSYAHKARGAKARAHNRLISPRKANGVYREVCFTAESERNGGLPFFDKQRARETFFWRKFSSDRVKAWMCVYATSDTWVSMLRWLIFWLSDIGRFRCFVLMSNGDFVQRKVLR